MFDGNGNNKFITTKETSVLINYEETKNKIITFINKELSAGAKDYKKNKIEEISQYMDELLFIEENKFDEYLANLVMQSKILLEEEIENHKRLGMLLDVYRIKTFSNS